MFSDASSSPLLSQLDLSPPFNKVCRLSLFSRTAVGGSGGEVVPAGRDPLPEGEAESQRLSGRLHHGHHWQEAAAAAESDGAASGGELQVHTHTHNVT